jgi:hypothetical protein
MGRNFIEVCKCAGWGIGPHVARTNGTIIAVVFVWSDRANGGWCGFCGFGFVFPVG